MKSAIVAVGTAVPRFRLSQAESAKFMENVLPLSAAEKKRLRGIYKATEIVYRHSVITDYNNSAEDFVFFPKDPAALFPTTAKRMQMYQAQALPLALAAIQDCFSNLNHLAQNQITHGSILILQI